MRDQSSILRFSLLVVLSVFSMGVLAEPLTVRSASVMEPFLTSSPNTSVGYHLRPYINGNYILYWLFGGSFSPNDMPSWNNTINLPVTQNGEYAQFSDGECAKFVQAVTANAKLTKDWYRGERVLGHTNPAFLKGKAIAIFNANGRYDQDYAGQHTTVVLNAETDGSEKVNAVWVMEQNAYGGATQLILSASVALLLIITQNSFLII